MGTAFSQFEEILLHMRLTGLRRNESLCFGFGCGLSALWYVRRRAPYVNAPTLWPRLACGTKDISPTDTQRVQPGHCSLTTAALRLQGTLVSAYRCRVYRAS
jgi:hypothetical protein